MTAQTIAQMQATRELLSENIAVQAAAATREIREKTGHDQHHEPNDWGELSMDSVVMTVFNQLTQQYTDSIVKLHAGSIVLGKELFYCVALFSVGLLGNPPSVKTKMSIWSQHT